MPEIRTFFRHCPACGRRFEIRLVSKDQVDAVEHNEDKRPVFRAGMIAKGVIMNPIVLEESKPLTIDTEEFQYTYRCKHCGHEWTETHEKTEGGTRPASYTGD